MNPLLPEIDDAVVHFIRTAYGLLLLGTLATTLPHARRFFQSERWGGYARSSRAVDVVQNPRALPIVAVGWTAAAVLLVLGIWPVAAALVNLVLCRYFFVWMRWRGVLRGMGAPGFMTYWLGAAVFLLELTTERAVSLRPLVLLALQVDLACVFLAAAISKVRAGYARGEGMELGLVNPQWGFWWSRYRSMDPGHPLLRLLDHLAWSTELAAALAMLVPATRFAGGLLLIASFALVGTQIRLGWLAPMVMLSGALFFSPESPGGRLLSSLAVPGPAIAQAQLSPDVVAVLAILTSVYITLLPLAYAGLAVNFYGHRRLPNTLQAALDVYANLFGLILWRVFSADLVDFFVRISSRASGEGSEVAISDYRTRPFARFSHVGEMITLTSLFTTLKYYPNDRALFEERLLRYARTLLCPAGRVLVFEYVSVRKGDLGFELVPVLEFVVDPRAGGVIQCTPDGAAAARITAEGSPIHEAARPGTYAPRAR